MTASSEGLVADETGMHEGLVEISKKPPTPGVVREVPLEGGLTAKIIPHELRGVQLQGFATDDEVGVLCVLDVGHDQAPVVGRHIIGACPAHCSCDCMAV